MSIFDGANALKLLHRFLDRKQAAMTDNVQPDDPLSAMNPSVNPKQHKQFDFEHRLHRIFVRLLHLKGLTSFAGPVGPDKTYLFSLYKVYSVARMLLEEEVSRITPIPDTDSYEVYEGYGDPTAPIFA